MENDRPIQLEDRDVNPAAEPGFLGRDFTVELPSEYLYNNVSHHELEIEHIVDACLPTPDQATLLGMRTDEPCLTLARRTWTNGTPVPLVRFVHPGNRYRLGSRFKPNTLRGQGWQRWACRAGPRVRRMPGGRTRKALFATGQRPFILGPVARRGTGTRRLRRRVFPDN